MVLAVCYELNTSTETTLFLVRLIKVHLINIHGTRMTKNVMAQCTSRSPAGTAAKALLEAGQMDNRLLGYVAPAWSADDVENDLFWKS